MSDKTNNVHVPLIRLYENIILERLMNNTDNSNIREHNVFMSDRTKMELTGIDDVESFTDTSVIATSSLGSIAIEGENIKIENFSSDTGILTVKGNFDSLCYFGNSDKKKRRLFSSRQ